MAIPAVGLPPPVAGMPPQPPPNITQPSTTSNNNQTPLDFSKILKPAAMNNEIQPTTGKEIVPVDNSKVQQGQDGSNQNKATAGLEIVPANVDRQQSNGVARVERVPAGVDQQIQIANQFVALQEDDGEANDGNQFAIVEDPMGQRSPVQNTKEAGLLNAVATEFTPRSGVASSKRGKGADPRRAENVANTNMPLVEKGTKESTTQWVSRTFADNVATNQSCQDIPSQSIEFDVVDKMPKNEQLQIAGNKLWLEQTEEDFEEGELPVGATGEEEPADDENDQEEQ
ncbi:hypothetical protein A4A49_62734, partial [Nicotiana attenuata]